MKIRDLMKDKGMNIFSVVADATVSDTVALMANNDIGSVIIMGESGPEGILTERDILRLWKEKEKIQNKPVREIMVRNLIVVRMDDLVDMALSVMIQEKIRHLLVVQGKDVLGILSIRDLVKAKLGKLEAKIRYLDDILSKDAAEDW